MTHRGYRSYTEINNIRKPLLLLRLKVHQEEMLLPDTKSRNHPMEARIITSLSSVSWRHGRDTVDAKKQWVLFSFHLLISYWHFLLVETNQSLIQKHGKHSLQGSTLLQKREKHISVRNGSKGKQAYDWHIVGGRPGKKKHLRQNLGLWLEKLVG